MNRQDEITSYPTLASIREQMSLINKPPYTREILGIPCTRLFSQRWVINGKKYGISKGAKVIRGLYDNR